MTAKTQELRNRTMQFALRVLRLFRCLPPSTEARIIGQQLLRSGTSVSANYCAVCKARSRPDFVSKLGIVEEEIDESVFWLELIVHAEIMPKSRMSDLITEARELSAIFAASRQTAKRNNRQLEVVNRKSKNREIAS
jgi:four helix bundle protein